MSSVALETFAATCAFSAARSARTSSRSPGTTGGGGGRSRGFSGTASGSRICKSKRRAEAAILGSRYRRDSKAVTRRNQIADGVPREGAEGWLRKVEEG